MILPFRTHFPDGTPTHFDMLIVAGQKIHTLRTDPHRRWRTGRTIHMATGVRTAGYNQFNAAFPHLQRCTGTQPVFMTFDGNALEVTVGNNYLLPSQIDTLIKNDGLTHSRFIDWFFPPGHYEWAGHIIHWTDCRY